MSSDDINRARETLRLLNETCSTAIDTLQQSPSTVSALAPTCSVLHKDFLSLLTLIYTSTTKLTLTLRAREPAYAAALGPLRDLATNITALTTCATLFDAHGATLAAEARLTAREVFEVVGALATTLAQGQDDYLVRTGAVHDLIDRGKRDLSLNNRAAVRKCWAADRSMLEDTLEEVASMIEGTDEGAGDEEGDFGDEEWDELGLGSGKKMSEVELERTKKVQPLLRFTTLLHKHVQVDILSRAPSAPPSPSDIAVLDSLPPHSHNLLLASEEVIASLYAPQNPSTIASTISTLAGSAQNLHAALLNGVLLPPAREKGDIEQLAQGISALTVGGEGKQKDVRKWFDTCIAHINRLSRTIGDTLVLDDPNGT